MKNQLWVVNRTDYRGEEHEHGATLVRGGARAQEQHQAERWSTRTKRKQLGANKPSRLSKA